MTYQTSMQTCLEEARESGVNAGWDAANYANAYNGSPVPTDAAMPGWVAVIDPSIRAAVHEQWWDGTKEGRARFDDGKLPDGSPADPDA